ncbi:MAG: hypothetical protein PHO07_05865 [Pirellulales bacterium]|jgi:hypothetical protein|nr:hypothetical protein [Pirellulales bacterium]
MKGGRRRAARRPAGPSPIALGFGKLSRIGVVGQFLGATPGPF